MTETDLKLIETECKQLVNNLFTNDKTPMECFGITWTKAEILEKAILT
ncbi:hypothetical protein KNT81_gp246 [Proteus phage phiP4-3]|uniref:Uncharacterized protein n=1 Tax=Proteus phage phiP4-3 TaxID=2065203 RepID=A0A2I6PFL8_9CAUD|nr:hypothetical protein KNT81_gp246 [Proteus phage phiP4-3]AUM58525.1 hypothetical protein phiP43_167 [Proteus phage phiP4-3]